MTLFNYARWIAKEVTGNKNIDKKIFVVGPAGSGKSMTGMALAPAVAKWISYYNHGNFDHQKDYFTFDKDHVAVINMNDLIHVMANRLIKNSVKIIDDCGASKGFTNRRSMSTENLDIVSIYGTNRVQNGVTIICVQDSDFTDIRMRKLANETIDLNDYYQAGPCRMAKLFKIRMDRYSKNGIRQCRFMTYEHGVWVTQESIACFLPPPDLMAQYDALRVEKERENTQMIYDKYLKLAEKGTVDKNKLRCPACTSTDIYPGKKHNSCHKCGYKWTPNA